MPRRLRLIGLVVWVLAAIAPSPATAQTTPTPTPPEAPDGQAPHRYEDAVEVVAVTPIHGLGVSRSKVPGNIQTATAGSLTATPGGEIGGVLLSRLASVHVNETQSNPFQPDIQFRGFTASPLLGLPQGLAIYQDGVRMNEPFGDSVNWELIPSSAIASINLMPGSNPLFGLNALGGALSIETKTGFSHPGHVARASAGSFGRYWADVESGGHRGPLGYFVTGRFLTEEGWRDHSPTRLRQIFGNLSWRGATTILDASVTAGRNRLVGNGPAPVELLEARRAAVFTYPDVTRTEVSSLTVNGRRTLTPEVTIDGVAFYRPASIRTFNGDDTHYEPCDEHAFAGLLCADNADGPVVDQFGRFVTVGADPFDATNNTSATRNRGWGGALQATSTHPIAGRSNHLVVGGSLDAGRSRYEADTELARLGEDRGTEGTGLLDSGAAVRLRTEVRHGGLFAADFFSPTPRLTLMGAARYGHSAVRLRDRLGTELTGDHRFSRLNLATGIVQALPRAVSAYGSYGVASRVPTPSELSCADPDDPCRLPNAFVADPPLQQVVAATWEGGLRGRTAALTWAASAFHTTNQNDLVFISSGALTNEGHFANVGDTTRRGLELSVLGAWGGRAEWNVAYTYLRAQFQTPLILTSPNHPDQVDGEIAVTPGDSLPSVPRHNLKASASVTVWDGVIGASLRRTSSQFFRGDEANLLAPIAGATAVDLVGRRRLGWGLSLVGEVTNVFDAEYATFGLFGDADEVLDGFADPRFVSPAAPRAAWIGLEIAIR